MRSRVHFEDESDYLASVAERLREVLEERLVGVYAGGSYALGGYLEGRSDLDVGAVVRAPLPPGTEEKVAALVRHEALPCPARSLEFVTYRLDTTRSGSAASDFELNLNTGEGTPLLVQSKGDAGGIGSHWFAIDRSILSQVGVALLGPPAGDVFAPIAPEDLVSTLIESVHWHREHESDAGNAVLNACRSLRFAETGEWSSKPAAGRWAVEHRLVTADLVAQALGDRGLNATEVRDFLGAAEARLRRGPT